MDVSSEATLSLKQTKPKVLQPILYLAGNTIGAGILALPILIGFAGFIPALIITFIIWIIMYSSGCILADKNVFHKENTDFVSIYEMEFGKIGKFIIILCYLFLFYGLSVAYLSGASITIIEILPYKVPFFVVVSVIFGVFVLSILKGNNIVLKFNTLMMCFLFVSFFFIIIKGLSNIEISNLNYYDWKFLPATFSVLVCSYGFHNTIPVIAKELKGDKKKIRQTIFWGSIIPLIFNLIIIITVLGVLPIFSNDNHNLVYAFTHNIPATIPLAQKLHSNFFISLGILFALLAIFTSYLAVGNGLFGFIKDLTGNWKIKNKFLPIFLAFGIPLIITFLGRTLFLKAINFSAGIGAVTIFGIMPAMILYKKRNRSAKFLSIILLATFGIILMIEILSQLHIIKIVPSVLLNKN